MTKFMYRFRPVKWLLGQDGVNGELDDQYIYFASPEQLNDPLEGYKNIYFHGDKVIWRNLIKHYLRCLIDTSLDYVLAEPGELPSKKIGVFTSAAIASEALNKLNIDIYEHLISESRINEFISKIAVDRKIRRWELSAYIQSLHFYFIDVVFESFHKHGILKEPFNYSFTERSNVLDHIEQLSAAIPPDGKITKKEERDFQKTHQRNNERKLRSRHRVKSEGREYWFFLLFEFPDAFCRDIEQLMYPRWYTACFMSSCSDSSIWGSYGGNHQDVCLKFKTEVYQGRTALTLTAPNGHGKHGINWSPTKFDFHEISYEKSFVDIDFFRSLGHLPHGTLMNTWFIGDNNEASKCAEEMFKDQEKWRVDYWKNFYHSVTVKLKAWDREKESRLIQTSMIHDLENDEHRKLRYDFNSLEGIIFGINTSMDNKLKIIKRIECLCAVFKRYDFSFYQARYDEDTREIMYDKLESIQVGFVDPLIS